MAVYGYLSNKESTTTDSMLSELVINVCVLQRGNILISLFGLLLSTIVWQSLKSVLNLSISLWIVRT